MIRIGPIQVIVNILWKKVHFMIFLNFLQKSFGLSKFTKFNFYRQLLFKFLDSTLSNITLAYIHCKVKM